MRALARDPDARWQTAAAMRAALVELHGPAQPAQIRDWVTWAVQREPPKVSHVLRVIDSFEQPPEPALDPEPASIGVRARRVPYLLLSMVSAMLALVLVGAYAAS
jgi:hypothetical protein